MRASATKESFSNLSIVATEWIALLAIIVVLLAIDLYRHRDDHEPTPRQAFGESAAWVACGLTFGLYILARQDGVFCETRTVRYAKSGACSAGYTLMGCTQSRYWKRAGGVSIMREIDDKECTYATKVLELKVRCCMVGAQAAAKEEPLVEGGKPVSQPATS